MDVLELLKADHQRIRDLFEQIRQSDSREKKRELFDVIKEELDLHTHMEETIFYPALASYEALDEMIEDSYDEHQEITDLLEEIDETDIESEDDAVMMDDDLEELIENVEYHVNKEEAEFFPQVRRLMQPAQLESLGVRLREMRSQLLAA